jgi:hypothetical protein
VTRLGEFSPIGHLFTLDVFMKITKATIHTYVRATFWHGTRYVLILTKSGCAKYLGHFSLTHGADFLHIFSGENSAENFPPKNVGKNWNFPRKKFLKIVFPRNSAENHFPRKKMYEKSAPGKKASEFLRKHFFVITTHQKYFNELTTNF